MDAMEQKKMDTPRMSERAKNIDGQIVMGMKLTGVMAAGSPIPVFGYLTSEHYAGSSNLTITILMDVLRRISVAIRDCAEQRTRDGEDPSTDARLSEANAARYKSRQEAMNNVMKTMEMDSTAGVRSFASEDARPNKDNESSTDRTSDGASDRTSTVRSDNDDDDDDAKCSEVSEDDDDDLSDLHDSNNTAIDGTKAHDLYNHPISSAIESITNEEEIQNKNDELQKAYETLSEARQRSATVDLKAERISSWPDRLNLQFDNSGKDNKNSIVFFFLALLVYYGVFKDVSYAFIVPYYRSD
jgi:hypothetical protein